MDIQSANCWIEIDKKAIEWNISKLRRSAGHGKLFMAVVKSNAYGHGMIEVAKTAVEAGADWLGVFTPFEAYKLRDFGLNTPILVFGPTPSLEIELATARNLTLTVSSIEAASMLASKALPGVRVHFKVETGTNRQGLKADEVIYAHRILSGAGIVAEGIYTHFADIEDTTDHAFAMIQLRRFEEIVKDLKRNECDVPIKHTACSAAAILFPSTHMNMVRAGIALYGLWPSKETLVSAKILGREALDLKPVMTWKTRIIQIKSVEPGEYVGYGRTYRTTRLSHIAVLPVGYADGYPRALSNSSHVLIRGLRAPVRGRVCMNLLMVDVTDINGAALGDEAVLLGSQVDERVSADDLARQAQTINYEIVTRAAPGAPRIIV